MSEDRLERIEKIVESNARAIQALADAVASDREERKQQKKGLYDYLARIASAQSDFYETQADFYRHLERMDDRHAQMIEIIENLGLKPRRSTTALLLNLSAFTRYMLECETWKKPIRFDFTPHQHKSRYCGAHWAV